MTLAPRLATLRDATVSPFGGALFAAGFVAAVAFLPGSMTPGLGARWAVLAVLLPLALLLSPRGSRKGLGAGLAVALFAFAALSLAWTPDLLGGADELVHFAILGAALWLGTETEDATPLWRGACWGVAVSAALIVLQVFGFSAVDQAMPPAGLFVNKNVAGEAALVGLIIAAVSGWWVFVAIFASAVVFTASKAVIGALAVAAAYWMAPRYRASAWALAVIVAAGFFVAFAGAAPSAGVRLAIWDDALSGSYFFGNGLGSYAAEYPAAYYAHSEPIQALYELGVPGFLALAALFVSTVWRRDARVAGEQTIIVGLGAASVLAFTFHMPFTAFAAAFAAGRALRSGVLVRGGEHPGGDPLAGHA